MKKLSKIIFPLTLLGVFAALPTNNLNEIKNFPKKIEQELCIGDPMPKPRGKFVKILREDKIEYRSYFNDKKNKSNSEEIYFICNGKPMEKPFAVVTHYGGDILYADNENQNREPYSDGLIDEIKVIDHFKDYPIEIPECKILI